MATQRSSKARKLPVESVETNIEGVYSFVPPPRGIDLTTASRATLLKHGILFRRPDPEREPRWFGLWKKFVTEIWTEKNFVVPVFEPSKDLPHILRGPVQFVTPNNSISTNWGGVVVKGSWVGAMGVWNVPTVSAPQGVYAIPASDGQYHSGSWVGLDGAPGGLGDVLQAGIAQIVNPGISTQDMPGGIGLYSAWAEWYTLAYPQALAQYPYLAPQIITSVPVQAGDQISVVVQYVQHRGDNIGNPSPPDGPYHFGAVLLVNVTTGKAANFYWPPPPQASFAGYSAEWIMELNDGPVLPAFSPLEFRDAGACNVNDAPPGGFAGAELQNGTVLELNDTYNRIETNSGGFEGGATIQYIA